MRLSCPGRARLDGPLKRKRCGLCKTTPNPESAGELRVEGTHEHYRTTSCRNDRPLRPDGR